MIGFYKYATGTPSIGINTIESALGVQIRDGSDWSEVIAPVERAEDKLVTRVLTTNPRV